MLFFRTIKITKNNQINKKHLRGTFLVLVFQSKMHEKFKSVFKIGIREKLLSEGLN